MRKRKLKKTSGKAYYILVSIIALAILLLVNIIVSYFDFRKDFTEDQRYSLTQTTVDFLESDTTLTDKILLKIYLEGDFPSQIKRMQDAVRAKLQEFRYYAGDKIEYQFINPNKGSEATQNALKEQLFDQGQGIRPLTVAYKSNGSAESIEVFPGAVVEYQGNKIGYIRFLLGGHYKLNSPKLQQVVQRGINNLEYKLMRTLAKATKNHKKTLAFIHGQGELKIPNTMGARKRIQDSYTIKDINMNNAIDALKDVDGIIIADPTEKFSNKAKFIIDQYLMNGGNIMIFNNPLFINNDTIRRTGKTHSVRKNLGLVNLLFDYGIKMNQDLVVDANCSNFVMPGLPKGYVNWYFYVRARGTKHPISSMVNPVKLPYTCSIQFIKTQNDTKPSVLLTSSSNSKSFGTAPLLSVAMPRVYGGENPVFVENPDDQSNRLMLAGMLEGTFESAFKNRIISEYVNNPNAKFVDHSVAPGKLLVVGNGTFFKNTYYDSIYVPEENKYRYVPRLPRRHEIDELFGYNKGMLGNFDFFENCVDYMLGDKTLLAIRSRVIESHPTDSLKVKAEGTFYKFINILIPVFLILLLAAIVFLIRRYKYVKK